MGELLGEHAPVRNGDHAVVRAVEHERREVDIANPVADVEVRAGGTLGLTGDFAGVLLILVAVILLLTSLCYLRRQTRSTWILNYRFHLLATVGRTHEREAPGTVVIERVLLGDHPTHARADEVHVVDAGIGEHRLQVRGQSSRSRGCPAPAPSLSYS